MIQLKPTNLWAADASQNRFDLNNIDNPLLKNFSIIGYVTQYAVHFDCSMYIAHHGTYNTETKELKCFFKNYATDKMEEIASDQSFRSLLQLNGLHFSNPVKKPDELDYTYGAPDASGEIYDMVSTEYEIDLSIWQRVEDSLVKKLLILKAI